MRIKFVQTEPFGELAKIEGVLELAAANLKLELAMTKSVEGPVRGVLKRSVAIVDLEEVNLKWRLFKRPQIELLARNLEAFENIPGSSGFRYAVTPLVPKREARSFTVDLRLAI